MHGKRCFLTVLNAVSHYTLRLFNTFVIFKKCEKINAKMAPKSMENVPKSSLGPPMVHLFFDFLRFGDR